MPLFAPALTVEEEDANPTVAGVRKIQFPNSSLTNDGGGVVSFSGGAAGTALIVLDEGSTIGTATHINFTGAGGTASFSNGTVTYDVSGGTVASMAGTAYRRTAGDYSNSGTVYADVDGTNMNFSLVTGARRMLLGFTGTVQSTLGSDIVIFDVLVNGTAIGGSSNGYTGDILNSTANRRNSVSFTYLTPVLTAGTQTAKIQWKRSSASAGTVTLFGDGTQGAASFWAHEVGP